MAESEVPEIRKAAVRAVHGLDGRGMIGADRQFLTDRVYRAVANERERCAKIAESNDHFPQEGEFIAAAIRQDNPNETEQGNG